MRKLRSGLVVLAATLVLPGLAAAQQSNWLVAPYIWMSDVGYDIESRGSGTIEFSDIVDKLDGAGIIRIEYVRNQIGFTFDYVGMSLSDNRRISTPGPLPINIDIRADLDLTMFEAGAFWRPSATDSGIDVLAGFRDVDVDSTLIVTPGMTQPIRYDAGSGFTDFYFGARYLHRFTESWDFTIRGDYGFGGSEGAINFATGVGWRTRGVFGMNLMYRHIEFDVENRVGGEPVTNEYSFSGPALGFLFRF